MCDLVNGVTVWRNIFNYNYRFAAKGVTALPVNNPVGSVMFVVQTGSWQEVSVLQHRSRDVLILVRGGGSQCWQQLIIRTKV